MLLGHKAEILIQKTNYECDMRFKNYVGLKESALTEKTAEVHQTNFKQLM